MDHRRPLVNGYSGYVPPHYAILEIALRDDDLEALEELTQGNSLTVVIDRRFQFERWAGALAGRHAPLVAVDGDACVYRLKGSRPSRRPSGERLMIQSVEASVAQDRVSRMLDGDWSTAWGTTGPQQGGETLLVDLGQERYVAA